MWKTRIGITKKPPKSPDPGLPPNMDAFFVSPIIYVSSIDAIVAPYSKTVPFSVTEAGLHMFARTTASNHGRDGITRTGGIAAAGQSAGFGNGHGIHAERHR